MKDSKLINNIVNFIMNNPLKVLLFSVLLVAGLGFGASKLQQNFSYRIWFNPDNPKLKLFDAFERKFGSDERALIIVHSPSGIFDKDSSELLTQMTEDVWQAPEVIRVDSLSNFNWVHAEGDDILVEPLIPDDIKLTDQILNSRQGIAVKHPSIVNYLISEDAKTALIFATLKPSINTTPNYEVITLALREIIDKYKDVSDHKFFLTGNPILNHSFKESTEADFKALVPILLLIILTFLLLSLRNILGVALSFLIILSTIILSMGLAGWMGYELNNLTSIAPQYMIAIAMAVAVHILVTYYQFYKTSGNKREALKSSLIKNFRPTLLTSISTAIGFYSFSMGEIPPIIDMGIISGNGTLLSWLATYIILAPLLILLPISLFRRKKSKQETKEINFDPSPIALRATEVVYKWRLPIIALSLILTISALFVAFKVPVSSDPFKYFDKSFPMRVANDFVEENIGGAVGFEIVIDTGVNEGIKEPAFLQKVNTFQNWLEAEYDFITKSVSLTDILKDMNKTLNGGSEEQYKLPDDRDTVAQQLFLYTMNLPQGMNINDRVSIKNDSLRITAMTTLHESSRSLEVIEEMQAKAKDMGLNAHVTGKIPLYQSNNEKVVSSFILSLSAALFLIAILLCIGLKSIKVGLISMLPNSIPLIMGGGLLYLLDVPLDIGTMIVGSVCIGIAVDDTIHFLANFIKFTNSGDSAKVAVAKVFTYTIPALFITTTVLVTAFSTFIFGSFVPNQNTGRFVAMILSIAFIADITFLPALVMSLNIWKPKKKKS